MMNKQEFREKYLSIRNNIPDTKKSEYDKILAEKLLSMVEFKNADSVLLFWSIGSELDTREIFKESIRQGKKVYFPKCTGEGQMIFFRVFSDKDFSVGKYNIPEPTTNIKYELNGKNSLAVIPALSVGRDFSRLGYGKGYYDRFLNDFKGISVCPTYPQLLCEGVPTGKFDIPMNIIITPTESLRR